MAALWSLTEAKLGAPLAAGWGSAIGTQNCAVANAFSIPQYGQLSPHELELHTLSPSFLRK